MHIFALLRLQRALAPVQAVAGTAQAEAQTAQATIAGQELQLQLASLDMRALSQELQSVRTQLNAANTKLIQAEAQTAAVNGKVITLQDLSNDYQDQLQKSIEDRAKLRQDLTTQTNALAAFQNRFRTQTVPIPAMALGASQTIAVTLSPAFADAAYVVLVQPSVPASLLGLTWNLAPGQTKNGYSIVLKNAGLATLLANAGTLHLTAIHL